MTHDTVLQLLGVLNSHRRKGSTQLFCTECEKQFANEFKFCPYCGKTVNAMPSSIGSRDPAAAINVGTVPPDNFASSGVGVEPNTTSNVGTVVFGAFAAISLVVSIVKGFVPLYLLESGGWAWAAWYWHTKKVKGELAKALVVLLGIAVGVGEIIHLAKWADTRTPQEAVQSPSSFNPESYGGVPVELSCPGALPAETTTQPLKLSEVSEIIGSEGKLEKVDTNWEVNLTYVNTTKDKCVTAAVVELDLSYGGTTSTQRFNVTFDPPLGPGKKQFAFPRIKGPRPREDVSLEEWHTISVSGFAAHSNPFDGVSGEKQ